MSRLAKDSSFPSTASTSQEDLKNGSSSTSSRKLRVTLLSSEWKSTKGGLSTINRELAIQLAKRPNVEVSVYLPQCSEEDKRVAGSLNVNLIEAKELIGFDPVYWLLSVPENHRMDCVIGHGLPLGRQVQLIQKQCCCKWIQVIHTAPEELGKYKSYAEAISKGEKKHLAEIKLCELADQVVAVGPKLTDAYSRYLRHCPDQAVLTLTPGIFSEFADVKQASKELGTFSVLVFGRGDNEDFELKGYDIAAKAIAELNDNSYHLMFVGAKRGKEDKIAKKLYQQGIARKQLTVRCFKESREQLAQLLCEVDLAIMPSRTEGFGLAALEALSAGLPVLVSGNSGLGEALKNVLYGSSCVVDSDDPKEWAKAIRAVRQKNREIRLEESKVLCGEYAKKYSWQGQCDKLVERMMTMCLGNTADAQDLHVSPKASVICQRSGNPLQTGSFHKGLAGIQASGKGKRPLSPSATPAPKQPRLLTDDHEVGTDISVVVKVLKAEYNRRAQLRPLLWDNTIQLPLENVYTRLKIVSRRKKDIDVKDNEVNFNLFHTIVKAREIGADDMNMFDSFKALQRDDEVINIYGVPRKHDEDEDSEKGDDVNMFNIFKALEKGEDVMTLVEGNPGIGKTTFCLKIAYDWANGKIPTEFSFPKFEFVLLLKCRDIDGDIMETISEQLLPKDIEVKTKEKLFDFIKDIHNQERILIILDGLDELPEISQHHVDELLHRRILPFCYVLATSRQERGIEVRKKFVFDIHLEIKGFTETDAYEYVRKHFENVGPGNSSKGERLIEEIKENTFLHALRNNPLNLLLLCVIYEDYEGELPTSRTELYQVIVQCLLRRFCAKRNLEAYEDNEALEKRFERDILALGELAWMCLLNNLHGFRETEMKELESRTKELVAREIGLLFKEESLKRLKPQHEYYFLHKTFQEYLAAAYIAHKLRLNQLSLFERLSFDDLVGKYPEVFLFVSGILGRKATILFTQIGEELKNWGVWDWDVCRQSGVERIDDQDCDESSDYLDDWDRDEYRYRGWEAATFFAKSFSESGHGEQMAITLCSFIPFPQKIEIDFDPKYRNDDDDNIRHVLNACKSFRNLQKPVELIVCRASCGEDQMNTVMDVAESCSKLKFLSIFSYDITSSLAEALYKVMSVSTSLSEFTLKVHDSSMSCDAAVNIGKGLAASKSLKKVTFALARMWGKAWVSALDIGLSANSLLTSVILKVCGPMSDTAIQALGKLLLNKALTSFSLIIFGNVQDLLAAAVSNGLARQSALKCFDVSVYGNISFSGANFLEKGLLENRSLNDFNVFVRGEIPDNWQSVVENLRMGKKAPVTFTFHPNPCSRVAGNQIVNFCPVVIEKGLDTKQHLTVNLWGELSCEGTEALCEVLERSPLSSLTLNIHGKLVDSVADCFARCFKPHKTLSYLMINIWGKLTEEGGTVLQGLSDNNLPVRIKVHDVGVLPDESNNVLDVLIESPALLASLFSEVKDTRKEKLSLTINNHCDGIGEWTQHLGDALGVNSSLTSVDLTINNYSEMNKVLIEGLGDSLLQSSSLTSFSLIINNYNNMTRSWDCILGDSLAKMSSLTTLSLAINDHSDESKFRGKGLSDSLIAIKSLSALCIVINGTNVNEFWREVLLNCLQQITSLKKLCLTVNNYYEKDDDYEYDINEKYGVYGPWYDSLENGLATTSSLNELNLTINNFTLKDTCCVSRLSKGLSENQSITTLNVTVNDYSEMSCDEWAVNLSKGLAKNNSITTLTLTENYYSEGEWLSKLVYCLTLDECMSDDVTVNTSLTTLNLTVNSCREVSEHWLLDLCDFLTKKFPLSTLRLQVNNQCASSGSRIYDFSRLLEECRSLSVLDLTVSFYGMENEC